MSIDPIESQSHIAVTPRDFSYDPSSFTKLSLARPLLPDALELPLLWMSHHAPDVIFTTTVDKLLAVTATDTESALHHGNSDVPPTDLEISLALWTRTVIYVMNRFGRTLRRRDLKTLASQFWTMKVFVDDLGNGWTANAFLAAVSEHLCEST